MHANGPRDTKPELELRSELFSRGLRYRVDRRILREVRRKADVVFGPARVAVYVDGCFWHGCPKHGTWPKANAKFWRDKILTNKRRDQDTDQRMRDAGWIVFWFWAHEDLITAANKVEAEVKRRRKHTQRGRQ